MPVSISIRETGKTNAASDPPSAEPIPEANSRPTKTARSGVNVSQSGRDRAHPSLFNRDRVQIRPIWRPGL